MLIVDWHLIQIRIHNQIVSLFFLCCLCSLTFRFWVYKMLVIEGDYISRTLYGGSHKWGYPQIIHLHETFHYKLIINHQFWGTPMAMETPIWMVLSCRVSDFQWSDHRRWSDHLQFTNDVNGALWGVDSSSVTTGQVRRQWRSGWWLGHPSEKY